MEISGRISKLCSNRATWISKIAFNHTKSIIQVTVLEFANHILLPKKETVQDKWNEKDIFRIPDRNSTAKKFILTV